MLTYVYVVARGEKLRLVTNNSAGFMLLNSLVSKEFHTVPLCGLQQLGYNICRHVWSTLNTC